MFELIDETYRKAASGFKEEWRSLPASAKWYNYVIGLPENQRITYTIVILHNQVLNGGFHQYFVNSYGQFAKETVHHLKQIRSYEEAGLLELALNLVKPENMSFASFRIALLSKKLDKLFVGDDLFEPLDKLDQKYYSNDDSVLYKLQTYLIENAE